MNSYANKDYSFLGKPEEELYTSNSNVVLPEVKEREKTDTFIGKMYPAKKPSDEELRSNSELLLNLAAGGPGMNVLGSGAKNLYSSLIGNIKKANTDIKPIEQELSGINSKISPLEEKVLQSGKALEESELSAKPIQSGIYHHPKNELENIESKLGKYLNIEGTHDVDISRSLANRADSIESYWKNEYKDFLSKIKDSEFQIPEKAAGDLSYDIGAITEKLNEGADPRKVFSIIEKEKKLEENPFVKILKDTAPTAKDTNAYDFIAKYKDLRDTVYGLTQELNSSKYSYIEKQDISKAINKGKEMLSNTKNVLDKGLGEFKNDFERVNEGYKDIFKLRDNPVIEKAKNGKLSETDIISQLRTNEPGMKLVRDMAKNDPEILRNLIGQRYKIKPSEIHNPDSLTREYINEMPREFHEMLKGKEKTLENLSKRRDISLKEKLEAEKQLKEIKNSKINLEKQLKDIKSEKSKAKSKLIKGSLYTAGAIGAGTIGKPLLNSYLFGKED